MNREAMSPAKFDASSYGAQHWINQCPARNKGLLNWREPDTPALQEHLPTMTKTDAQNPGPSAQRSYRPLHRPRNLDDRRPRSRMRLQLADICPGPWF